jgi:hypothetical protein
MKKSLLALVLAAFTFGAFAAEPAKKEDAAAVQNDKCVKKDKNGKCPPLPTSPKPTPKKVEGK